MIEIGAFLPFNHAVVLLIRGKVLTMTRLVALALPARSGPQVTRTAHSRADQRHDGVALRQGLVVAPNTRIFISSLPNLYRLTGDTGAFSRSPIGRQRRGPCCGGSITRRRTGTHVHNFPDPAWFICRCTKQAVGAIVKGKRNEYRNSCQRTCRVASLRRLI